MKKFLFLSVLACIIVACSSVMITGRKQLLLVPDTEVLALSAQSYSEFIASAPLSKNTTNTALIKKVGKNISTAVETYLRTNGMAAEIANYAWEFSLVQSDEVNAFCMPGGKVVFYEGILPLTKTEAGIAVVMGHEIAHAVAKHSSEQISQQMVLQYGAAITDALTTNKSEIVRGSINTLYGIGAQVGVTLPFSRTHEYEADRLGLIFMAMAGYDPSEAVGFWERMAAANASAPLELLSTHPSDNNRIAKIKELLPEAMQYYKK
jgi:Putative Zn-dependent protease, contains TPR repeats